MRQPLYMTYGIPKPPMTGKKAAKVLAIFFAGLATIFVLVAIAPKEAPDDGRCANGAAIGWEPGLAPSDVGWTHAVSTCSAP